MIPVSLKGLLQNARAGELIYSCLAFHGPDQGGELAGTWLVVALDAIGVAPAATRQALFRLEQQGHVAARKEGRSKWYRLTTTGEAQVAAGRDRLARSVAPAWDGAWTLVCASFTAGQRRARLQLLAVLEARGYGRAGAGLHIHPHDDAASLMQLVIELRLAAAVQVFRGELIGSERERTFVGKAFPLRRIASRYRRFLRRFEPYTRENDISSSSAFALRLAAVLQYLDAAWDDPGLPARLLPGDWPAFEAQRVIQELYQGCSRPARRFAVSLASQLKLPWKESSA